ncbi:MAG: PAS domain S-box protein [Candidatus Hermodarchaeota archaeon]
MRDLNKTLQKPFKAYSGSDPFIFVSYSHNDKDRVYPEIKRLYDAGYRVWYDEGIPPITDWSEEIARGIENCVFFLVFISLNAVNSIHVKNEIYYALNEKKKPLLIYLEAVDLPRGLKFRLGSLQAIMKFQMLNPIYYQKLIEVIPSSLKSDETVVHEEQQLRELVESLPQAVFTMSLDGTIMYMNPYGQEYFGYALNEIIGVNFAQFDSAKDRKFFQQIIKEILAGKQINVFESSVKRKDGTNLFVAIYPNVITRNEEIIGLRGIIIDVTERKRAEQDLVKVARVLEEMVREKDAELSRLPKRTS